MKKIHLFITLALMFTMGSFAQLDKKTWLVGGSGSFDAYKQKQTFTSIEIPSETKFRNLEVSPKVGYFFIDKLAGGGNFTYSNWNSKNSDENSYSSSDRFFAGPFVRYYFLEKNKSFNILAESSYQIGILDYEKNVGKHTENKFNFLIGTEIFFNSTVGMEFLLDYRMYNRYDINTSQTQKITTEQNGLRFSIGFQIHLQK